MGLDLGREMFSASRRRAVRALWRALKAGGRKLRARRPRSPKQLHCSGLGQIAVARCHRSPERFFAFVRSLRVAPAHSGAFNALTRFNSFNRRSTTSAESAEASATIITAKV